MSVCRSHDPPPDPFPFPNPSRSRPRCGTKSARGFHAAETGTAAGRRSSAVLPGNRFRGRRRATLRAYNALHLQFLSVLITADLRERSSPPEHGWANQSLSSRLPDWITDRKNRAAVLKALAPSICTGRFCSPRSMCLGRGTSIGFRAADAGGGAVFDAAFVGGASWGRPSGVRGLDAGAHVDVPASLSITLCLWSPLYPPKRTARAWLRRVPAYRKLGLLKRRVTARLMRRGPGGSLPPEPLDFYPSGGGFSPLVRRHAFPFGPLAFSDYCQSLLHIIQATDSGELLPCVRERMAELSSADRRAVAKLVHRVESGDPVAGKFSPGHTTDPTANFTACPLPRFVRRSRVGRRHGRSRAGPGRESRRPAHRAFAGRLGLRPGH